MNSFLCLCLFLVLSVVIAQPTPSASPIKTLVYGFEGTTPYLASDNSDTIYVSNRKNILSYSIASQRITTTATNDTVDGFIGRIARKTNSIVVAAYYLADGTTQTIATVDPTTKKVTPFYEFPPAGTLIAWTVNGITSDGTNTFVSVYNNNTILKITPTGQATVFATVERPAAIEYNTDLNLLFSAPESSHNISYYTAAGVVSNYADTMITAGLYQMTFDTDNNLYYVDGNSYSMKRLNYASKTVEDFSPASANGFNSILSGNRGIVLGGDKNIYAGGSTWKNLVQMSASGKVATEVYRSPVDPYYITVAFAGALFVTNQDKTIRQISNGGISTTYTPRLSSASLAGIAAKDGGCNLYITDESLNDIYKVPYVSTGQSFYTTLVSNGLGGIGPITIGFNDDLFVFQPNDVPPIINRISATTGAVSNWLQSAQLNGPADIKYSNNYLYVANSKGLNIIRIDSSQAITTVVTAATGNKWIVIAPYGNALYALKDSDDRIYSISLSGSFPATPTVFLSSGHGYFPADRGTNSISMTFDYAANLYVTDVARNRIIQMGNGMSNAVIDCPIVTPPTSSSSSSTGPSGPNAAAIRAPHILIFTGSLILAGLFIMY